MFRKYFVEKHVESIWYPSIKWSRDLLQNYASKYWPFDQMNKVCENTVCFSLFQHMYGVFTSIKALETF